MSAMNPFSINLNKLVPTQNSKIFVLITSAEILGILSFTLPFSRANMWLGGRINKIVTVILAVMA